MRNEGSPAIQNEHADVEFGIYPDRRAFLEYVRANIGRYDTNHCPVLNDRDRSRHARNVVAWVQGEFADREAAALQDLFEELAPAEIRSDCTEMPVADLTSTSIR
ncbi:hypothetical protein VB618_12160 [Microvirga sp. CF3062]|uniref:hypothetical protein n=1 Tax=Microvirga sp. CF3062 TaxID=3110182 RepID=UPI002E785845|nr:hypothetical protein [Microvirga sp. CF3062]MEE1656954.1 hypothetical protein [Microvirga sp. CF3062]